MKAMRREKRARRQGNLARGTTVAAAGAVAAACLLAPGAASARPARASAAAAGGSVQAVKVMTYNILELTNDGRSEGGNTVAPWSKRLPKQVQLINQASPDVIDIEEGSQWVGAPRGQRQVDSLVAALGGAYSLASTEIPPSQPHFFRTGDYILYKTATYEAVGTGDHWTLPAGSGPTHFTAYQELQNRATGARFIDAAVHLQVGFGTAADQFRETQTQNLISQSQAYASRLGVPIVYGGDFNSSPGPKHAIDGPAVAMRAANIADAYAVAKTRSNQKYDSANGYQRKPPAFGAHIDHIYVPAGIGVASWGLVLNLKHGKFVGTIPSDHNPLVATVEIPY